MFIAKEEKKLVVDVFHNDGDEMEENLKKLKEDGWSGNIRQTLSGIGSYTLDLYEDEEKEFREKYPDIKIHPGDKEKFLFRNPYVFYTKHEKIVKE
ncbi:hypothetical protein QO179_23580 [Bacillus stercoris]|nr:hypothetical protein [Bacillus stercoris]